jgi:hypothetical protein
MLSCRVVSAHCSQACSLPCHLPSPCHALSILGSSKVSSHGRLHLVTFSSRAPSLTWLATSWLIGQPAGESKGAAQYRKSIFILLVLRSALAQQWALATSHEVRFESECCGTWQLLPTLAVNILHARVSKKYPVPCTTSSVLPYQPLGKNHEALRVFGSYQSHEPERRTDEAGGHMIVSQQCPLCRDVYDGTNFGILTQPRTACCKKLPVQEQCGRLQ